MRNIWTNGCYDVVHIGHISLLEYAKSLGDNLFIGIDSDERVKKLKGNSRPINNQDNRQFFLQSIKYVDGVFIFNDDNELKSYIKNLNIDTIVVGEDYRTRPVIGSELANIVYFNKIYDISTSKILEYL